MELLMESDAGFEMVDQSEKKEYDETKARVDKRKAAVKTYITDWQGERRRIVGSPVAFVNNRAPKKEQTAAPKRGKRIWPSKLPPTDISQAELKDLCPLGGGGGTSGQGIRQATSRPILSLGHVFRGRGAFVAGRGKQSSNACATFGTDGASLAVWATMRCRSRRCSPKHSFLFGEFFRIGEARLPCPGQPNLCRIRFG